MPKPVVAAVNGPAVGIGCSLALACDLVVAAESAYLLLAFVNIGLVPDGGSSVFVPARAGAGRAAAMAMLGERIPAAQGDRLGPRRPARARLRLRGRGRRAGRAARHGADAQLRRRPSSSSTRASTPASTSSSSSRRALQQEMAGSQDFSRGCRRSSRSAPPASGGE
jgi:2-(1,2-epoxy-1,2-dihydrophenyl)acetyl-CoA isomerase